VTEYIELERKFWPVEADKENDPEHIRTRLAFGVDRRLSWDDLLKNPRIVILAEPGTGKTEELRAVTRRLRVSGIPAFFCRIEILQSLDIRQAFDPGLGTGTEFDEWVTGKGEQEGYFFLDSVDEARLHSHAAFEIALQRFAGALGEGSNLHRAKVVVSCRVSNWRATADLDLFSARLPIPQIVKVQESEEASVKEVEQAPARVTRNVSSAASEKKKEQIVFQLAPLDEHQIRRFAVGKGVNDPNDFLDAIQRSDAEIFAERPQDLVDLIAFWKSQGRLGQHEEMLEFNVQKKLEELDPDRDAKRPLSPEDALVGAERLAAALTVQKKNTIALPDRPVDPNLRGISIDPKESLRDWSSDKIQTLLDRAIFDEAFYGTVRFHHRTVREYLTARWLHRLLMAGKSRKSIEALLFATRYEREVVIPSMRPIAAWLAVRDDRVRARLRTIAPEVLIEHGDPSALPVEFRKSLLIGFAELHAVRQHTTGTSFDITMCRRLADPQLAPTINDLLRKFATHEDVRTLLLKLIWQGQIVDSVEAALSYAMDDQASGYTRTCAIRAVAAAGTSEQRRNLVDVLLRDTSTIDSIILGEICEMFFPDTLSVQQLLEVVKIAESPERYSSSEFQYRLQTLVDALSPDHTAEQLLRGLYGLLKSPPFIEHRHCEISMRYAWLLSDAIRLANQFLRKQHPLSFDPIVFDLFLGFFALQTYGDLTPSTQEKILKSAESWPEFRFRLFWHAVAAARAREMDSAKHPTAWWQVRRDLRDFWLPSTTDLDRLFECLDHKPLMDDRLIALTAVFSVYVTDGRPRQLQERMKCAVAGTPELKTRLDELLHPKPLSDEEKKDRRGESDFKRRQEAREKSQNAIRQDWQQALKKKPQEINNVGNAQKGEVWQRTTYLYDRMTEKGKKNENRLGYPHWQVLSDEFGSEVAKNFRDGCVAYWRDYDPFLSPNRRTESSIPWPRIIGLSGLAMETADNPVWVKNLTPSQATIAARYALCELNGFPSWLGELRNEFPDIVDAVIKDELRWELHESPTETTHLHTLSALQYGSEEFSKHYQVAVLELLSEQDPLNNQAMNSALALLLTGHLDAALRNKVAELASRRFETACDQNRKSSWLSVLLCIDGVRGYRMLKEWITGLSSVQERKEKMIDFCTTLAGRGDSHFAPAFRDYEKIEVLNELVPFIYEFVKVTEDAQHKVTLSPGTRDNVERSYSRLLGVIVHTPGRPSYDALMNLSKFCSSGYSKDRMDYLAKERAALDAEGEPWFGADVAEFAESAERQPRTEADLYDLASARLDDMKTDIEDGDESEAVLFQRLAQEPEVRRVFANRLRKSSRSLYTVGSEEELADATRTDIRLNAPQVSAPVPIELKIADNWTLAKLRERLENQLIGQYMRASHYGIFLVVHNGKKKAWQDTCTKKRLSFAKLVETLKQDATDLVRKYPKVADLAVVGIDFTARSTYETRD